MINRITAHSGTILVVAPAGYGKSTLVRQWAKRSRHDVGWLHLHSDIDGAAALSQLISDSLTRAHPGSSGTGDAVPTVVLDEFQNITDPSCLTVIDDLIHQEQTDFRLIILSRRVTDLHVARQISAGEVMVLNTTDLAFTFTETMEVFEKHGLALTERIGLRLHERTEGWPTGIRLATMAMGQLDENEVGAQFGGTTQNVKDYFNEEVLHGLDEESREFIVATSLLEEMSGPLCDAVTGRSDSGRLLADLERTTNFVTRLDGGDWYRHHPLLGEMLRHELEQTPERVPALNRRAARWLSDDGRVGDAIRHLLATGDTDAAIDLLGGNYFAAIEAGDVTEVAEWLDMFPRGVVVADARLSVVEAWVMSITHQYAEATVAIDNALRSPHTGTLPDGASSVQSSAALIRASFSSGDVNRMLTDARRALEFEDHDESPWRATVHVLFGLRLYFQGDVEESAPFLERGAALARSAERWMDGIRSKSLRAWVAMDGGDAADALEWAERAIALVDTGNLWETPYSGYPEATLGAAMVMDGNLTEGIAHLERGTDTMRPRTEPLLMTQCLLALTKARLARGWYAKAKENYEEAASLLSGFTDPGFLGGRLEQVAEAVNAAYHGDVDSELSERELEVLHLLDKEFTKRQIADELFVSYNTIHSHVRSIYRKLGVGRRDAALETAQARGLLPPREHGEAVSSQLEEPRMSEG